MAERGRMWHLYRVSEDESLVLVAGGRGQRELKEALEEAEAGRYVYYVYHICRFANVTLDTTPRRVVAVSDFDPADGAEETDATP